MCNTEGAPISDANAVSVCDGGEASSCIDNQPWMESPHLSLGFAAAAVGGISGLEGDTNCGQCFELLFLNQRHDPQGDNWGGAHPNLVGKTHIIQVTNIGYDVGGKHSFDLQIPGAGQGIFDQGCIEQFPEAEKSGDFDCDNNYGGCHDKSGCSRLPIELRPGCEWRYDWFEWLKGNGQTNNPYVTFRRIKCPTKLTDISGSVPLDDDSYPSVNLDDYH